MKRTHSGDLSLNSSPTSSNTGATNNRNQNQQQQADANRQRAPAMQAPAANDPPPANPLFGLDVDTPLPDWEEFAQMLPHTPPVENRRDASDDEALSASDDDRSTKEWSFDETSSNYEEGIGMKISAGVTAEGHDTIIFRGSSVRELGEFLDICKRHPQITIFKIAPAMISTFTLKAQEKLIEFFSNHHSIRELHFEFCAQSESSIHPKLLSALLRNHGLKTLITRGLDLIVPMPEDRKEIIEGIKRNSSLENLTLMSVSNNELIAEIIEAMADRRILKQLDLTVQRLDGIVNSIERLLTLNSSLKALKFTIHYGRHLEEVESIFKTIAHNHTLELLRFGGFGCQFELIGKNILNLLTTNQGLKYICLPESSEMTDEVAAALTELIKTHPKLTSIHIGSIPRNHQARMSIAHALKSNPRISRIAADLLPFYSLDIRESERPILLTEFLNTIGDCPSLTALSLESIPDLDCLIKFLETHPQISYIAIPNNEIFSKEDQEKLLALVRGHPHIKKLTIESQLHESEEGMQFRKELWQALALNQEVSSDAKIAAASRAMFGLLADKANRGGAEPLPWVPPDITHELAKAIARHMPAAKAKAIFDELILHAPVRQ
jgi:hypothetical protein